VTTAIHTQTETTIDLAQRKLRLMQGGMGDPVVVLHHSTGGPGWIPLYDKLADSFTVTVPDLPGYGQSERPEWAREPRDLGILMLQALQKLGLNGVHLVGLGFGGFVAAEMATMDQARLKSLTLVGAPGIQPRQGEIVDQMLVDFDEYVKAGFRDDATFAGLFGEVVPDDVKQLWDFSREMTARVTWKPYMFNRRLPYLLGEVATPTLLIWGEKDVIVPIDVANQYQASLKNAKLEIVPKAGHLVDLEEPGTVASLITKHAKAS
jgi:pimeloyl-ACP methyl ester carboxylesterase